MKLPLRDFSANGRVLLASVLITNLGNGMHNIVLGKALYDVTGEVTYFAWLLASDYIFALLLQVFTGPVVDRTSARRLAIRMDVARGLLCVVIAISLMLAASMAWVFVWVLMIKIATQFYSPSLFAVVPTHLPEREVKRYVASATVALQVGQILGIALVGVLMLYWPNWLIFILDAATYLVSALLLSRLRAGQGRAVLDSARRLRIRLINDWLAFVRRHRGEPAMFWHLFLTSGDYLMVIFINIALVPIVFYYHGDNTVWLSILDGAFAVGAVAAPFMVKQLARRRLAPLWPAVQGMAFLGLTGNFHPLVNISCFLLLGFANSLSITILISALMQRAAADELGRVASARRGILSLLLLVAVPGVSAVVNSSLTLALLLFAGIACLYAVIILLLQSPAAYGRHLLAPVAGGNLESES